MALSNQIAVSDGTLVLLDLGIEYFDRSEIVVLFDGIVDAYPWAWVGETEKKLSFDPAVPLGVEVKVQRLTDVSAPLHSFTLGAAFTAQSLDEQFQQILHVAQEVSEGGIVKEVFQDFDVHGFNVKNVGTAVASGDAVNLGQMNAALVAADSGLVRADLASTASGKGAALVGYSPEGGTVKAALDVRLPEIGTYALLRAYTGSLTAYYVRGVANILDGGAGVFRVDAADTTSADNGGTILVDAAGRRWKREFSGAVNVKWFDAKGDGTTNDSVAIQSAIDALPSTGGTVHVPNGRYLVTAGLLVNKVGNVSILGDGGFSNNSNGTSQLYFTGTGACITIGSAGTTVQNGCHIAKLYIEGNNSAGQVGIRVLRNYRNMFEMVHINEMLGAGSIGFDFNGTGDITVINELLQCGVRKVTTGIKVTKATSTRVSGGFWNAVGGTTGIDLISDDTVILDGANFDGWITAVQTANLAGTFRGLRLMGCRFEGNTTAVNISALVQVSTLVGNYFNMGGSGTGINVASGATVTLSDNVGHNVTLGVGSFITNANDSALGNNTTLFAPLISRAVGQKDIVFSDLTTAVTGSGSVSMAALKAIISTGATAGSTALARTPGGEGWSVGKAYTVINWNKKFVASFTVSRTVAGSVNSKFRITLGKSISTGVGDLAVKGVGITFNRFQPVAVVHDGTSLTSTNLESFNIDVAAHTFTVVGHGNGTFDFNYDSKPFVRLTSGPTGDGVSGNSVLQFEAENGVDASDNPLVVNDARIWFEQ